MSKEENFPLYKHQCPHCLFLARSPKDGSENSFDLYYCACSKPTIVARYGDVETDFYSGFWIIKDLIYNNIQNEDVLETIERLLSQEYPLRTKALLMTVKLAIKNGFLSNDLEPLVIVQDAVQVSNLNETIVSVKLEKNNLT